MRDSDRHTNQRAHSTLPTFNVNILAILFFLIILISTHLLVKIALKRPPPLLIISFDGFRHDYIERAKEVLGETSLPNFDYFIAHGTRALRLISVFPTLTLPNHQTMVTGLYPQRHGVTANTMRDPSIKTHYLSMINESSLRTDPWLDKWPEPLWVTAQRDFGLTTATHLWPITERNVAGVLPKHRVSCPRRNISGRCTYPNRRRIDDIVGWLVAGKISLILAYFCEVDIAGHLFGPNSTQVCYFLNNSLCHFKIFKHSGYRVMIFMAVNTLSSPWGIINFNGFCGALFKRCDHSELLNNFWV